MKYCTIYLFYLLSMCGCANTNMVSNKATDQKELELPAFNVEGHRGIRGLMPENTIASMLKAIDYGVQTVELDVVISKDKQVVVSHDIYFHPDISTHPSGKTITADEAPNLLLYNMTYDSIKNYDVGLKPHKDFPEQMKLAATKPLLSNLIDATDAYAKSKGINILYNIEIKANPDWDNKKQPAIQETVELVMNIVQAKKLEARCYLQSFDFRPLQILHAQYPNITTAVLIGGNEKRSLQAQLNALGYTPKIYSPAFALVNEQLVASVHAAGMKIVPWTVNKKQDMKRMIDLGVDGLITDYADRYKEL